MFILCMSSLHSQELQKPKVYHGYENIKNWVMSEKLDGIRGYWDGEKLKTKKGNTIHAPKWFTKKFPPFELDGELWTKRGDFENIQSIVLVDRPTKKWEDITYNIFEVPNKDGNFTQRLQHIKNWIVDNKLDHVKIIEQKNCKNKLELKKYLHYIEKLGGEGVVIKNPKLPYFYGRSSKILKVKSFKDMEGKVIGINKGKGRFENIMGSLTLRLDNGIVFKLGGGFKLKEREHPPQIGKIVTFKYYGLTKNKKPKFASFLRIREDE